MTSLIGRLLAVDLSNVCRDRRFGDHGGLVSGSSNVEGVGRKQDGHRRTGIDRLDRFLAGAHKAGIGFERLKLIADRSLPAHLVRAERRALTELEHSGVLEFSSLADERLLELAFGSDGRHDTLIASMDWFDDFRRTFPMIQGCTDRFVGWDPRANGVRVFFRDMGEHKHRRISRKEEVSEFKARRLHRDTVVRRATAFDYRCDASNCLLGQLWPDRLPELPRYDDRSDRFVCPSCSAALDVVGERPRSTEVIVQYRGVEQFRLRLVDGEQMVVGRTDAVGQIGMSTRLPNGVPDGVSRQHLMFTYDGSAVRVRDLGSRNGTLLRDPSGRERRLEPQETHVFGPSATVVLPSDITLELSGRSSPRPGESPDEVVRRLDDGDGRMTRILSTRR